MKAPGGRRRGWTAMPLVLVPALALGGTLPPQLTVPAPGRLGCPDGTEAYTRVELFFGLSRPGAVITDAEFKAFVDDHITPRFPAGLTLLAGSGQFRDTRGTIVTEGARLLILLTPQNSLHIDAKIEAIRAGYRREFQQQSVLRADAAACVSF
jgi:hypothetical protein